MAFTGVASAQTSNAQVVFFTSPSCSACAAAHPIVESAAAKYGVPVSWIDITTSPGKGIATANDVSTTPTIVVSGAQSARFEGSITQAQIESAIQAAIGTTTPAAKATVAATPAAKATVAATTTPKAPVAATTTPKATATPTAAAPVKAAAPPTAAAPVKAAAPPTKTPTATPTIQVVAPTPTTKTTTSTVPEFSVLGLGAPALLVGAIYLFLRRQ